MKTHVSLFQPSVACALCVVLMAGVGCKSIGPKTVTRDRMHYATAVADSWKEQLLLNIVKTRYADAPAFLEVVSVVSGYSLETGVNLNGQFSPESLRGDTFAGAGAAAKYTDRPTISYSPMSGEEFAHSLLSPVPLDVLWFVIQGGVPADFLLGLTTQSIAGHHNLGLYGGQWLSADPDFDRLLQLLQALHQARVLDSAVLQQGEDRGVWISFHSVDPSATVAAGQLTELKALLGVPADADRVEVVFGAQPSESGQFGMRTRSLMQVLNTLGAGVQIPPDQIIEGGAIPVDAAHVPDEFTVKSGEDKPDDAFVAVPYEGLWFWIDRSDVASKTTLAAVTVLFNFLESGESRETPVLTIPTN